MEPTKAKMGSPEVRTAGDTIVFILTSWNIKPGILLAIHNGAVVYDGEAALAPKEVMSKPGVIAIMHVHDKQRLDAALNKAARLDKRKGPLPQNPVEAQRIVGASPALAAPYDGTTFKGGFDAVADAVSHGLQPKDAMEYHAGNRTDSFHPSQLPGLLDHLDASDPKTMEGRGIKPDWPFKSPQVKGDPINENYADPDPRFGADDQGKAGWGNKTDD